MCSLIPSLIAICWGKKEKHANTFFMYYTKKFGLTLWYIFRNPEFPAIRDVWSSLRSWSRREEAARRAKRTLYFKTCPSHVYLGHPIDVDCISWMIVCKMGSCYMTCSTSWSQVGCGPNMACKEHWFPCSSERILATTLSFSFL